MGIYNNGTVKPFDTCPITGEPASYDFLTIRRVDEDGRTIYPDGFEYQLKTLNPDITILISVFDCHEEFYSKLRPYADLIKALIVAYHKNTVFDMDPRLFPFRV